MADFNIRTDAVDVEQIMRQIRARIESKRGVDYTEQQIQELANVKLERFLNPKGRSLGSCRSVQARPRRKARAFPDRPELRTGFDAEMLYGTHRGIHPRHAPQAAQPHPEALLQSEHADSRGRQAIRGQRAVRGAVPISSSEGQQRDEVDVLYYELVHNLVLELTRIGIENRNLKMRLESLSSRMDFDERRARALEGVVQYRPGTGPAREPQQPRPRPDERPAPPPPPLHRLHLSPFRCSRRSLGQRPRNRPASRIPLDAGAADGVDAAVAAAAHQARAWQQEARRRKWRRRKTRAHRRMATRPLMPRRTTRPTQISTTIRPAPATTGTTPVKSRIPQRSEARCRGAALRRGHQRRRRAARPLRRGALVPARCR